MKDHHTSGLPLIKLAKRMSTMRILVTSGMCYHSFASIKTKSPLFLLIAGHPPREFVVPLLVDGARAGHVRVDVHLVPRLVELVELIRAHHIKTSIRA